MFATLLLVKTLEPYAPKVQGKPASFGHIHMLFFIQTRMDYSIIVKFEFTWEEVVKKLPIWQALDPAIQLVLTRIYDDVHEKEEKELKRLPTKAYYPAFEIGSPFGDTDGTWKQPELLNFWWVQGTLLGLLILTIDQPYWIYTHHNTADTTVRLLLQLG